MHMYTMSSDDHEGGLRGLWSPYTCPIMSCMSEQGMASGHPSIALGHPSIALGHPPIAQGLSVRVAH